MMTCTTLEVDRLCRDFGGTPALTDMTAAFPADSVVALLGPNGAGKTTFMKLVAGLLHPSSGTCRVFGDPPRTVLAHHPERLAVLLDGCEPPPDALCGSLVRLQAQAYPRFDQGLAERLGFGDDVRAGSTYGALSKGRKRRLLAALAIGSGADLVLLDEPADGLDPRERRRLYEAVRDDATARGSTTLIATHIIHDVERVADYVVILDYGKTVFSGNLEDIRDQVRAVGLPSGTEFRIPAGWEILADGREQGGEIIVRCPADLCHPSAAVFPGCRLRPVPLEELSLAVTTGVQGMSPDSLEEVESC